MADAAITDISDAELVSMLNTAKKELFNLRFQLATGQLDNTARIKQVKREVARARTEMRSREIRAAEALGASEQSASLRVSAAEAETPENLTRSRGFTSPRDQAANIQAGDAS